MRLAARVPAGRRCRVAAEAALVSHFLSPEDAAEAAAAAAAANPHADELPSTSGEQWRTAPVANSAALERAMSGGWLALSPEAGEVGESTRAPSLECPCKQPASRVRPCVPGSGPYLQLQCTSLTSRRSWQVRPPLVPALHAVRWSWVAWQSSWTRCTPEPPSRSAQHRRQLWRPRLLDSPAAWVACLSCPTTVGLWLSRLMWARSCCGRTRWHQAFAPRCWCCAPRRTTPGCPPAPSSLAAAPLRCPCACWRG
jgi:hypothetical protein